MATDGNVEVICLSSDNDVPQSSRSGSSLAGLQSAENVCHGKGRKSSNGKNKGVWKNRSVSPGQDGFRNVDISLNKDVDVRQPRKEHIEPTHILEEDPISRWGDNSQDGRSSSKRSCRQVEKDEDLIFISDTPAKPSGRTTLPHRGLPITHDAGFSTTTASILAGILGSKASSDDELGEIDRIIGYKGRRQSSTKLLSKKRRSTGGGDDIQNSDVTSKTKRKRIVRDDDQLVRPPGSPTRKKGNKLTEVEREERAGKKARKAAQKEAEKVERRAEKEAKALEKQKVMELDTVNKLKASKKESVKEIIVDISDSFAQSPSGQQLLRFLETQGCASTVDWNPPIPNVIKWRRKVVADWNEDLGYFIPIPESIRDENHILIVVKADDFVDMVVGETDLDDHVNKIKALLAKDEIKVIYMIEGLTALLRKSRNAKNRTFQGAVRQAIGTSTEEGNIANSRAVPSRSRKGPKVIDEDMVEDALLSLQIRHGCLVHHTISMQETSEWISVFTGDISTIPYKLSRMNYDTSFCADAGQVRTGNDAEDTYFKMLQEITRVTAGVANGVMEEYKSVRQLMNACKREGETVIADLEVDHDKQNWYFGWEENWPGHLEETSQILHRTASRFYGHVRLRVLMVQEWDQHTRVLEPEASCSNACRN